MAKLKVNCDDVESIVELLSIETGMLIYIYIYIYIYYVDNIIYLVSYK